MNTPLITWAVIVALFVVIMIVRIMRGNTCNESKRKKFFKLGSEREEFFIPGDPTLTDLEQDDYDN